MSYYVAFDGELSDQVATNTGWADFGRWVDDLDDKVYPELVHLREHGWSQRLDSLGADLVDAVEHHAPDDADTLSVVASLQAQLHNRGGAEVATITDGMTP